MSFVKTMKGIITIDKRFLKDDGFSVGVCGNFFKFDYMWSFEIDLSEPFNTYLQEEAREKIE